MFSGLPPQQGIDGPAAANPVVDPTGVKCSQDLDDVLERHPSHDAECDWLWLSFVADLALAVVGGYIGVRARARVAGVTVRGEGSQGPV